MFSPVEIKVPITGPFYQSEIEIFKVTFSTFLFNPYDVEPSGATAERGTSHVT